MYGAEICAPRVKESVRLRSTEAKMLKWLHGKILKDHVRNADLLEKANLVPIEEVLRRQRLK